MPYIKQVRRDELAGCELVGIFDDLTPGELNYIITTLLLTYWTKHRSYQAIAEITGVLENVKQEFYRRVAAPYEDAKCAENGDVY